MPCKLPRLILLLALGIVGASCSTGAQTLAGCWTNELGSTVNIMMDKEGYLRGKYTSAVSRTGTQVDGVLIGTQDDNAQPTFGFAVMWTTDSVRGDVSVWAGQMFGDQTLKTMWLERSHSTLDTNWGATMTGMDVFNRCK